MDQFNFDLLCSFVAYVVHITYILHKIELTGDCVKVSHLLLNFLQDIHDKLSLTDTYNGEAI
jgi:hypothetical protein